MSRYSDWLRARRSGIESRWGWDFPPVQTGLGAHPASCKMGTGSFPGIKWPGRGVDHLSPFSAAVMEEYSYTSTHPQGHTGSVTGSLYLLFPYISFCTQLNVPWWHSAWGAVLQIGRSLVRSQLVSSEFFTDVKFFRSHYGPGVESASNRNEYQEHFLGVKAISA